MFYSQFGEDKILFKIFKQKPHGVCIEVGANNGIQDSNSFFFEKIGWRCILVEPNPSLCKELRLLRKNSMLYEYAASNCDNEEVTLHIASGASRSDGTSTISVKEDDHKRIKDFGFVTKPVQVQTMTLDKILMMAKIKGEIDFVSIDVEGHEYEVLQGFCVEKWRPSIILIEDNSNFKDNTVSDYLTKKGYVRFRRTGVNDWYAHQTNRRLVNIQNKIRVFLTVFKAKVKNRLGKTPFFVKCKKFFK